MLTVSAASSLSWPARVSDCDKGLLHLETGQVCGFLQDKDMDRHHFMVWVRFLLRWINEILYLGCVELKQKRSEQIIHHVKE